MDDDKLGFDCDIKNRESKPELWLKEMNNRFDQLITIFPTLPSFIETYPVPVKMKVYLFENICEEYENYYFLADWLNYCGIENILVDLIQDKLNISVKALPVNKANTIGNYQQTNPTLSMDESVNTFIEQLQNNDLDIPYKYLFMVSHSHFMKHLLQMLYKNSEKQLTKMMNYYNSLKYQKDTKDEATFEIEELKFARLNKQLLENTINNIKQYNNKKPGHIYFNNLDILGIVRLKIAEEGRYMIIDTFILQNFDEYQIKNKLKDMRSIMSDIGINYNINNISIIYLTRHCYACHNTIKLLERTKMFDPGYSKYSMCIPEQLIEHFHSDKIDGLIQSIKDIEQIYTGKVRNEAFIKRNIMFGSSFILRAILTITILGKLLIEQLSINIFRRMREYSRKDVYCPTELTLADKIWMDYYKRNPDNMNNCYSKYLKFHKFDDKYPEVLPDETFETYKEKLATAGIEEDLDRYKYFIEKCELECDYTDDDVRKIEYGFQYI